MQLQHDTRLDGLLDLLPPNIRAMYGPMLVMQVDSLPNDEREKYFALVPRFVDAVQGDDFPAFCKLVEETGQDERTAAMVWGMIVSGRGR